MQYEIRITLLSLEKTFVDTFLQALVSGILLGGFYAVMVLGFSVIWGVMGVINLAHGKFLMIGAYFAWAMFRTFGLDPFVSMLLVLPVMFAVGYALQWGLINRVVERPHLISLLVTFGLSISVANLYKLIYTASPHSVSVSYNGSVALGPVTLPIVKSLVLVVALVAMVALYLFLQKRPASVNPSAPRPRTKTRPALSVSKSTLSTPSPLVSA